MVDERAPDTTMTVSVSGFAPSSGPRLLVFTAGGRAAHALPKSGEVSVGRGEQADIRVDDPSLSRVHAKLKVGSLVVVEDLGSRNGTHVNGRVLHKGDTAEVIPGDAFGLGKVVCIVEVDAAPAPREAKSDTRKKPPTASSSSSSAAKKKLDGLIALVAGSDISAVLCGETGVGKEVTARAIHDASSRKSAPFLGINCAALPENLLESELFGYERGAFSGAVQAKPGLFEAANGGTVFLDEVADMSPAVQAKLLRVLEERQVMRLGSLKPRSIDVRFLAASHKALDAEVAAGRFRQDLFFRLNGITLQIPPLRQRVDEIEGFAARFLADASARRGTRPPALHPDVVAALRGHPWPGNVRELKNVIDRALLLSNGADVIEPEHVVLDAPARTINDSDEADDDGPIGGDDERARILRALKEAAGNQTRAAELLGVSRRTLVNRIIAHNIPRPRKGG
jgi:transcriptional regulator with PAS, ATPase and Fis domain